MSSLNGSGNFKELKRVELDSISKLQSLGELRNNASTLKELKIEACKNIKDFGVLTELTNLEKLSIVNCGELPSLRFIQNLPNLKFLVFLRTNILDGDLSYCKGIDYVAFDNKKHYSHKISDFVDVKRLFGSAETIIKE